MRIFDLLNDGDAAAALIASAHAPPRAVATDGSKPSSTFAWEAQDASPTQAFPAFLLNENRGVCKPWKPQAAESAPEAEQEQEQEQQPQEAERVSLDPFQKPRMAKPKARDAALLGHAKTMSIFDIVATNSRSLLLHPQPGKAKLAKPPKPVPVDEPEAEAPRKKRELARLSRPAAPKRVRMAVAVAVPPPSTRPEEDEADEEADQAPTDTQAQKRQRQRVLFRRNYYKRMNTIAEMREVRAELEEEYQQLLWKRNAEQMVKTYLRKGRAKQPVEEIRERYMDLCRAKDMLRTENSAIERELQDVRKVHDKMRWLVDAEGGLRADDHIDLTQCPAACQGADPLSKAECVELTEQCAQLILRHVVPSGARSAVLCSAFGWEFRRQHFMATRLLLAEKRVAGVSASTLTTALWRGVTKANEVPTLKTIVGKSLLQQCYVVQRVSHDHMVLFMEFAHGGAGPTQALCLVSRSAAGEPAVGRDTIITVQALPAPFGATTRWIEDLMAWVRFTEVDGVTRMSMGMSLPSGASQQEDHWLGLLVVASMQLETELVGTSPVHVVAP